MKARIGLVMLGMGVLLGAATAEPETDEQMASLSELVVKVSGGGRPIVGAAVEVSGAEKTVTGKTNTAGVVSFAALPRGPVTVGVSADGWHGREKTLDLDRDEQTASFDLRPRLTTVYIKVSGSEDGASNPIDQCTLTIFYDRGQQKSAKTNSAGKAKFRDLPRGRVKVTADAVGWKFRVVENYSLDKDEQTLELELEKLVPPEGGG